MIQVAYFLISSITDFPSLEPIPKTEWCKNIIHINYCKAAAAASETSNSRKLSRVLRNIFTIKYESRRCFENQKEISSILENSLRLLRLSIVQYLNSLFGRRVSNRLGLSYPFSSILPQSTTSVLISSFIIDMQTTIDYRSRTISFSGQVESCGWTKKNTSSQKEKSLSFSSFSTSKIAFPFFFAHNI